RGASLAPRGRTPPPSRRRSRARRAGARERAPGSRDRSDGSWSNSRQGARRLRYTGMESPSGSYALLPDERAWKRFEGTAVDYRVPRRHPGDAGGLTLLLRFAAGSSYPAHEHPEGEEYYVLDGTLLDSGREYPAGSFVYHAPGSVHRPSSRTGCVVLVN